MESAESLGGAGRCGAAAGTLDGTDASGTGAGVGCGFGAVLQPAKMTAARAAAHATPPRRFEMDDIPTLVRHLFVTNKCPAVQNNVFVGPHNSERLTYRFFAGIVSPKRAKKMLRLPEEFHRSFSNGSETSELLFTATV